MAVRADDGGRSSSPLASYGGDAATLPVGSIDDRLAKRVLEFH
jgi:hypothetical protein